jgi:hypothetical protein
MMTDTPVPQPMMPGGKRVPGLPSLAASHAVVSLAQLPGSLRRLENGDVPVEVSHGISERAVQIDAAMAPLHAPLHVS